MIHGEPYRNGARRSLAGTRQACAPSRRGVLRLALLLAGAALVGKKAAAGRPAQRETRAIFDEDFSWLTREQAEVVLSRVRAAGFNVFVPCIWQGQGTWWPSRFAPWCEHPLADVFRRERFDAVGNLIEVARSKDVDVLLWMNVMHAGWERSSDPHSEQTTHRPIFTICTTRISEIGSRTSSWKRRIAIRRQPGSAWITCGVAVAAGASHRGNSSTRRSAAGR